MSLSGNALEASPKLSASDLPNPIQAELQALRDKAEELADDVRALATLVHELRRALVSCGVGQR